MKSCRKVEMDIVFSVRWLLLRQHSKYLVLYIWRSVVTVENVCYELVRWESLHILEIEWTHAKSWTVFTTQLTRQGLWRHHAFLLLCNNNCRSVFISQPAFLKLLYKQLCLGLSAKFKKKQPKTINPTVQYFSNFTINMFLHQLVKIIIWWWSRSNVVKCGQT